MIMQRIQYSKKERIRMERMNDGGDRMSFGEGRAIREPTNGKGRPELISPYAVMRLAKWMELGAQKYADRNWECGMPYSRYVGAMLRHTLKYMMGMDDEDHLAAIAFNVFAIMHHEECGQIELDDMPHYEQQKQDRQKALAPDEPDHTIVTVEEFFNEK